MSLSLRRVAVAAAVLLSCHCHVASAQTSFGIGSAAHREAEGRILQTLEKRDSFKFEAMPLATFVQLLRDRFAINVLLDRRALDDAAIDTATPVSLHLLDATLEAGLNLVLEQLALTWTIRHEALLITTLDEAESLLATRFYPVRDLVLIEYERTFDADFDSLTYVITSTIEPDSWDEVGGPGAIEGQIASLSLVVSQTWHVHRQLEHLLTTMRTVRDKQGLTPISGAMSRAPVVMPQPRSPRRYRSSSNSTWQVPRIYD